MVDTPAPVSADAADALIETNLDALQRSRGITLRLVEDMTPEQLLTRACDGGNHALWTLGHLASADAMVASVFGATDPGAPERYHTLFGMGSEPTDDASDYPSIEDVRSVLTSVHERMVSAVRAATPELLSAPMPEGFDAFAPSRAVLLAMMAMHEGMHIGQLTVIRRSLGLPRVMG